MAQRFCRVCGDWHDLDRPWPAKCVIVVERAVSPLPFPMIISDSMDPTEHVDGQLYTSKSSFRRVTRERGYVEIGNEKTAPFQRKDPDRQAIKTSLQRAKARIS